MSENNNETANNRTLELLKASLPYMNNSMKKPIQVMVQVEELTAFMNEKEEPDELSMCGMNEQAVDVEAMLVNMKNVCTGTEQETLDNILNFIRVQKMYSTYQTFMKEKPKSDQNTPEGNNNSMFEYMMSQMSPDQKNQFESLSMMMSMMNNV